VVWFRIDSASKVSYLGSLWAGVFGNPIVIDAVLTGEQRNNALDPLKSGGVFVNANIAAAYLGMGAFAAWNLARAYGLRALRVVALLLWIAVFFTGSKAGFVLALGLPLAIAAWQLTQSLSTSVKIAVVACCVTLVITSGYLLASFDAVPIGAAEDGLSAEITETALVRFSIWSYAASAFFEAPLLGQGFGGWQEGYGTYATALGIDPDFPPHNTLIYLWSQSGALALLFGLGFMTTIVWSGLRLMTLRNPEIRSLGICLVLVSGWLFVHGLGENWGVVGEPRQQVLFAALLGLTLARYHAILNEEKRA